MATATQIGTEQLRPPVIDSRAALSAKPAEAAEAPQTMGEIVDAKLARADHEPPLHLANTAMAAMMADAPGRGTPREAKPERDSREHSLGDINLSRIDAITEQIRFARQRLSARKVGGLSLRRTRPSL